MSGEGASIMQKKILAAAIAVAMVFAWMPLISGHAQATQVLSYDSATALKYVKNLGATKMKNMDCTELMVAASQKGGVPAQKNRTWGFSAKQYMDYLINDGYAVKYQLTMCDDQLVPFDENGTTKNKKANLRYEDNKGKIAPGDLIIYYCKASGCKKYFHFAIAHETAPGYEDWQHIQSDESSGNYWTIYGTSSGKGLTDAPFYRFAHSGHTTVLNGETVPNVSVYCLHFTSRSNGYSAYTKTVSNLKGKKLSSKTVKLTWTKSTGATKYKIYARGSSTLPAMYIKTVTTNYAKVSFPKNGSGKYYSNPQFAVAPVKAKSVTFEGITKKPLLVGGKGYFKTVKRN